MSELTMINSLSLLALKAAPRVFDISSDQYHVSIRDQMVRAQQLMRDLKKINPNKKTVLIIGAGVAGVTAAMSACEAEIDTVYLLETAPHPFSLFRGVHHRYVGPFMYEWPSSFHDNQGFPSHPGTPWESHAISPLSWQAKQPISAHALGDLLTEKLTTWLRHRQASGQAVPSIWMDAKRDEVKQLVATFAKAPANTRHSLPAAQLWPAGERIGTRPDVTIDYIILAAGMGSEAVTLPGYAGNISPLFWKPDKLKLPRMTKRKIAVLGGGDGAIQDTLRALTSFDHPLELIRYLEQDETIRATIARETPALLDADRQVRQHMAWNAKDNVYRVVDQACRQAAARLAQSRALCNRLFGIVHKGKGQIRLMVRGQHFDKAYLLNRFVAYLLAACFEQKTGFHGARLSFQLLFQTEVLRVRRLRGQWRLQVKDRHSGRKTTPFVDHLVLRFGIDRHKLTTNQMIQITQRRTNQRSTLRTIELPFANLDS